MREDDNQGKFSKQQLIKTAIDFAKEGRWQEAITVNQQILQLIPQDVDAHNRLGKAYVELGEYVHAKEAYKKSLELDPANNIAKRNLRKIIPKIPKSTSPQTSESPQKNTTETDGEPLFDISNRVRIRETKSIGVVTSILPNRQYQIFLNENEQPIVSEKDLEAVTVYPRFVTPQEFLRDLLIFKLKRPLSDTLYSYSMSRTNFEVYQFKPAIKFLNSPNGRILIADEVGLGKTIEACIIYLELKTRMQGDLPRVLIVCPAGLRNKWQSELTARFGEEFTLLGTNQLRQFFSEYETAGPAKRLRGICSIEALRREELCARIVESGVQFDLVVIDEAHHMRNPDTLSFDLGETLSEHSDSLLLLTATPVHLQSLDLY
ncbi:MAG: tetratricopeptide repeat protein, partial [Desulfobacteraceae bacterium]|nr:tetratricopeptide repeat protein [Desulfobacteraceae bacterium]